MMKTTSGNPATEKTGNNSPAGAPAENRAVKKASWKEIYRKIDAYIKKIDAEERLSVEIIRYNRSAHEFSARVCISFDEPRLKKILGNISGDWEKIAEMRRKLRHFDGAILEISASKTKDSFIEAVEQLRKFYRQRKSKMNSFDKKLEKLAKEVKETNKIITKYNSEYVRARKAEKEEMRKALEDGRYVEVTDDKMLKDYFDLSYVTVLDRSTKHRAVLFAHLTDYYNEYRNPGPAPGFGIMFGGWGVDYLVLAGVDDNEEMWEIRIDVTDEYHDGWTSFRVPSSLSYIEKKYDVEEGMKRVWGLKRHAPLNTAKRQGDILICPLEKYKIYEWAIGDTKIEEETIRDEFEVFPNHKLIGKNIKVIEYSNDRAFYVVESENNMMMKHISHDDVKIEAGKWLILSQIPTYDEQNID